MSDTAATDQAGRVGASRERSLTAVELFAGAGGMALGIHRAGYELLDLRVQAKVLTVHSRGAEVETIRCLVEARSHAILHWYSGPPKHIDTALAGGLWFSVNPAMLRSKNGQRIVAALPRDRVVTETDGQHAKLGQRPSEPSDIPGVIVGLARAWNVEPEEARQQVSDTMSSIARAAQRACGPRGPAEQPND